MKVYFKRLLIALLHVALYPVMFFLVAFVMAFILPLNEQTPTPVAVFIALVPVAAFIIFRFWRRYRNVVAKQLYLDFLSEQGVFSFGETMQYIRKNCRVFTDLLVVATLLLPFLVSVTPEVKASVGLLIVGTIILLGIGCGVVFILDAGIWLLVCRVCCAQNKRLHEAER